MDVFRLNTRERTSHRNGYGGRKLVPPAEVLAVKLKAHAASAHNGKPQPATCAACRELSGRR